MQSESQKDINAIDFECQFWEGQSSFEHFENPLFVSQWAQLLDRIGGASVFQTPGFVIPWYLANRADHCPVLITAWSQGNLTGILPLARKVHLDDGKQCKNLFGAGGFYALYQTWVVDPKYLGLFWEKGVLGFIEKTPGCSINLKSLPGEGVFASLKERNDFNRYSSFERYHNPVLDFGDDSFGKIIGKRHFKSKFNRFSKAGRTAFRKIEKREDLDLAFNDIEVFYNLRQGAAFNKTPFPPEKNEREVFLEWLEAGVLHVTGLWLDDQLVSAVVMMNDRNHTAHLAGLITFSPLHAKYSPGLVHLYLLSQLLKQEGFKDLKLSPGYDSYKERFSNAQEDLFELLISKSMALHLRRKTRVKVREALLARGIRPMEASVWLDKKSADLRNKLGRLRGQIGTVDLPDAKLLDSLEEIRKVAPKNGGLDLRLDDLKTLLLATDQTFTLSRWAFLQDSLRRLENNQRFLTISENNKLFACVWFHSTAEQPEDIDQLLKLGDVAFKFISKELKL
jgi:hypothetical protein